MHWSFVHAWCESWQCVVNKLKAQWNNLGFEVFFPSKTWYFGWYFGQSIFFIYIHVIHIIETISVLYVRDLVPIVQLSSNMIGPSHIETRLFGPRALWFHNSMLIKPIFGEYSWVVPICLLPSVFECLSYVCSCCHFYLYNRGRLSFVVLEQLHVVLPKHEHLKHDNNVVVIGGGITCYLNCL